MQTIKFDDLNCGPPDSSISSAARLIRRFGVQTGDFDDFDCRPSNSMIWNSLHNVTHPFGSAIPDAPYSHPQQGIAFIAAMAPKRATRSRPNPALPHRDARSRSRSPRTRASQPYVESPYRKALAAWHRFNDYVLRKFYEDLHKWWTERSVTNAVPYFQRMPRIGSLID